MKARQRQLSEGVAAPCLLFDILPFVFLDVFETREAIFVLSLTGTGSAAVKQGWKVGCAYVAVNRCLLLISSATSFHVLFCEMNKLRI